MDVIPASALIGAFLVLLFPSAFLLLRMFHRRSEKTTAPRDNEAARVSKTHKNTFLDILELDKTRVEDIMIPRSEIAGVDFDDNWAGIVEQLQNSQHARLPVYEETIDNVLGILHLRVALAAMTREPLTKTRMRDLLEGCYFIPEATPLHTQLLAFQENRKRIGLVVDEYGDIQGLVTLEDILEEIVGEFTTDPKSSSGDITPEAEGSFLVSGSIAIRGLNRALNWKLPTDGPKTLNGLILETLETIPHPNTSVRIEGYPLEVVQTTRNAIKLVRVRPPEPGKPGDEEADLKTGEFTD